MNKNNNNDLSNSSPINHNQNKFSKINDNQNNFSSNSDKLQNILNLPLLSDQNEKEINISKKNNLINKNSLNRDINIEEPKQIQNNISDPKIEDNKNNAILSSYGDGEEIENPIFKLLNEKNQQITIKDSYVQKSTFNIKEQLENGINNNIIQNSLYKNNEKSNNVNNNQNNNNEKLIIDNNISKTCLQNYGDTSYLNAVLHCLANIDDLKNFFLEEKNAKYITNNIKEFPLSFVTCRLFKHFYVKKDTIYSLESYLRVLGSKNKIFDSKKSRNANDCLTFILNTLDNELNRPNNKNEKLKCKQSEKEEVIKCGIENFKNEYNSLIYNVFNWFQLKELHCLECGEILYYFNTYNTCQLENLEFYKKNNTNSFNLVDCLKFERNKTMNLFCHACKNKTNINIISTIYKAPKFFVFLLNDGNFNDKYSEFNFILEENINLKLFINDQNSPTQYQLFGIVSIDANNKKYVSFCKLNDGQWYLFSDETFSQIQQNKVIQDNDNSKYIPSILFYKSKE